MSVFHIAAMPEKGPGQRGVVADMALSPGDTVFIEQKPLVCAPLLHTRDYFKMCDQCLRSMERPDHMLARLAGLPADQVKLNCLNEYRKYCMETTAANADPVDAAVGFVFDPLNPQPVACPHCPLEVYCSPSCRQMAWDQHHRYLCPRTPNPAPDCAYLALANLWKGFHPPPEDTSPFLVARIICHIRGQMELGASFETAAAPFMDFMRAPQTTEGESALQRLFLNTSTQNNGSSSSAAPTTLHEVHAALVNLVAHPSLPPQLLTFEAFLDLFGLVALNAQGIGTSAWDLYQIFLSSVNSPTAQSDMDTAEALDSLVEEVSAPFLRAEGSGLFPIHRLLNHSCNPNAECKFESLEKGYVLRIAVKRPIARGEEITIGYIEDEDCEDCEDKEWEDADGDAEDAEDAEMEVEEVGEERPGEERRRQLKRYYMFDCRCERCVEELKGDGGM